MRIEIVAIGTELLLGQIADTNSAWLGDRLASAGVTSHFHQAVGDNHERIVLAFRTALARSDGIIVCGGLGPTQDDITREWGDPDTTRNRWVRSRYVPWTSWLAGVWLFHSTR